MLGSIGLESDQVISPQHFKDFCPCLYPKKSTRLPTPVKLQCLFDTTLQSSSLEA